MMKKSKRKPTLRLILGCILTLSLVQCMVLFLMIWTTWQPKKAIPGHEVGFVPGPCASVQPKLPKLGDWRTFKFGPPPVISVDLKIVLGPWSKEMRENEAEIRRVIPAQVKILQDSFSISWLSAGKKERLSGITFNFSEGPPLKDSNFLAVDFNNPQPSLAEFLSLYNKRLFGSDPRVVKKSLVVYVTSIAGGVLGCSTFPGDSSLQPFQDGVVIDYRSLPSTSLSKSKTYSQGDTMVHEIGHWLGQVHTFTGNCMPPGDNIFETAPSYYNGGTESLCSSVIPIGEIDPLSNFMSYGSDTQRKQFVFEQLTLMELNYLNYRS